MQPGFLDLESRRQSLEKLGDSLPKPAEWVDWEGFRSLLDGMHKKGRKHAPHLLSESESTLANLKSGNAHVIQ